LIRSEHEHRGGGVHKMVSLIKKMVRGGKVKNVMVQRERGHAWKRGRGKGICHFARLQIPNTSLEAKQKGNWFFQFSTKYLILSCVLNSGPCTCLNPSHHPIIHHTLLSIPLHPPPLYN